MVTARGLRLALLAGIITVSCSASDRTKPDAPDSSPALIPVAFPPVEPVLNLGWVDLAASSGLSGVSTRCKNVSFADIDGDGDPDLLVPMSNALRVHVNDGAGRFSALPEVRLGSTPLRMNECSMAVDDLDGDGRVDVVIGLDDENMGVAAFFNEGDGNFTPALGPLPMREEKRSSFCIGTMHGTGTSTTIFSCREIDGAASMIDVRNCGYDARGINVECPTDIAHPKAAAWTVAGRALTPIVSGDLLVPGNSQGLGITDFDADGRDDLFVAIDFAGQRLIRGGPMDYVDVSRSAGVDVFAHGMGVALGDIDEDGLTDAVVTTIGGVIEFRGRPGGFVRVENSSYSTRRRNIWPWSALLEDVDNNGRLDLLIANGYASAKPISPVEWLDTLGGPADFVGAFDTIIFEDAPDRHREGRLLFESVLPEHGRPRSLALADVDGDGQLELAIPLMRADRTAGTTYDVAFGRLTGVAIGHGLTVRFSGRPVPVGTRVTLRCGGRSQTRTIYGAEGMGAAARREVHFGCGEATVYESLRIEPRQGAPIELAGGSLDSAVTVPL